MEFDYIEPNDKTVIYINDEDYITSVSIHLATPEQSALAGQLMDSKTCRLFVCDDDEGMNIPHRGACSLFVRKNDEVYIFNQVLYHRAIFGGMDFILCYSFGGGATDEKRLFGRVLVQMKAEVVVGNRFPFSIEVQDISNNGICFSVSKRCDLSVGSKAIIFPITEDRDDLYLSGEVVRKTVVDNTRYSYGILIDDPKDQKNAERMVLRELEKMSHRILDQVL